MNRARNLVVTVASLALLLGLAVGLIVLFSAASQSQPSSQALVTAAPLPADSTSTPAPHSAGILFESAGELYWQPVDEQGTATATVVHVPISLPEKSKVGTMFAAPDGKQVLYEVYSPPPSGCCELQSTLFVFAPPNGQPRQINPPASLSKIFGWHPNSHQLICGESQITLFDVDTGENTLVAEPKKWAEISTSPQIDGLAFSPDGKKLITSFTPSGQAWEVWIANADGSDAKKLFDSGGAIAGFAWSPDGGYIAFVHDGVEIMWPDGQDRRSVGHGFGGGKPPVWSSDSRYIAFTVEDNPGKVPPIYEIRIVDIVAGAERNLINDNTSKSNVLPTWSPSGLQVLFLSDWSDERGGSEVWIASLDGTQLKQLTADGYPKRSAPIWLPILGR